MVMFERMRSLPFAVLFASFAFSTLPGSGRAAPRQELKPAGEEQHVTVLSFNGQEFINAFNATSDRLRLVLVFSPT